MKLIVTRDSDFRTWTFDVKRVNSYGNGTLCLSPVKSVFLSDIKNSILNESGIPELIDNYSFTAMEASDKTLLMFNIAVSEVHWTILPTANQMKLRLFTDNQTDSPIDIVKASKLGKLNGLSYKRIATSKMTIANVKSFGTWSITDTE